MKIAVCDDDKNYINTFENYVDALNDKHLEYDVYYSGEELLYAYENNNANYDTIFLDMEMNKLDGIETANLIRRIDNKVIIVFITSYTKYMQESFQCMPFRFLIKPIDFEELKNIYSEICTKLDNDPETFIFLENKKRTRVFCSDIIFFECCAHSILIHIKDGSIHKIRKNMTELIQAIEKSTFVRVHRAYVVNMRYIYQISESDIIMHDYKNPIPVSRTYKKHLDDMFLNFKERKYMI